MFMHPEQRVAHKACHSVFLVCITVGKAISEARYTLWQDHDN